MSSSATAIALRVHVHDLTWSLHGALLLTPSAAAAPPPPPLLPTLAALAAVCGRGGEKAVEVHEADYSELGLSSEV